MARRVQWQQVGQPDFGHDVRRDELCRHFSRDRIRQLPSAVSAVRANAREKTVQRRSIGFLYAVNDFFAQQLSHVPSLISVDK